jgi:hypothetical protein
MRSTYTEHIMHQTKEGLPNLTHKEDEGAAEGDAGARLRPRRTPCSETGPYRPTPQRQGLRLQLAKEGQDINYDAGK